MDPTFDLSAAPAVRLTPQTAVLLARELARACWPWPEGREQDTMLWTVLAERVGWNLDDVDTDPGEFTVGEFLSDLQHLIQAVQSLWYAGTEHTRSRPNGTPAMCWSSCSPRVATTLWLRPWLRVWRLPHRCGLLLSAVRVAASVQTCCGVERAGRP
jgi:hypothetical protein